MNITEQELTNFRSTFADYPEALSGLDKLESCDNNLDAAAEAIALENGYINNIRNSTAKLSVQGELDQGFLDGITEQAQKIICHKYSDDVLDIFKELRQFLPFPISIAALLAIKIVEIGVENFCTSFETETPAPLPNAVN
ncbi:MAG: hypothetical protein ACFB02_18395 [Mastigocoleus sp.]